MREQVAAARAEGTDVLVYVGAHWCEPCQRFHAALTAGTLDRELLGLRLVEFDLDSDAEALRNAGYASQLIPLFALPRPDGRSSGTHVEGSIKDSEAVRRDLLPRLRQLLGRDGPRPRAVGAPAAGAAARAGE